MADWMTDAACRDLDPDLFFPSTGYYPSDALEICEECPVRDACLEHALTLSAESDVGVWGGTTRNERRELLRRRGGRRAAA